MAKPPGVSRLWPVGHPRRTPSGSALDISLTSRFFEGP